MHRLRFLSFNIHGGQSLNGKRNTQWVNELMDRLDIDVGVFQEMDTRTSYGGNEDDVKILAGIDRPHYFYGPSMMEGSGWFGNLIVSRYPIVHGIIHNLETQPRYEPRNAIDVVIKTILGNIRVIGTHLSLALQERRSEARNLVRLIKAVEHKDHYPLLLMGDINEWQWPSRLIRYLNSVMHPVPCRGTFPSFFPILRLDRVWHDAPGLKVMAHRLPIRGISNLSDHLPLMIEVLRE